MKQVVIVLLVLSTQYAVANDIIAGQVESRYDVTFIAEANKQITQVASLLDQVKRGDVLIQFACDIEQAQVNAARARVSKAQAHHQAQSHLHNQGAVAKYQVQLAKADVVVAKAEQRVEQAKSRRCQHTAPFDGVVQRVNVKPHQMVKAGMPLLRLTHSSELYGHVAVDRHYFDVFEQGQTVNVALINGTPLVATISKKSTVIEPKTQRFDLELAFNQTSDLFVGRPFTIQLAREQ